MNVYTPAEDSFLIRDYLTDLNLEELKVLDMGTGSGVLAIEMAEKGADVTAADINPEAIAKSREKARQRHLEIEFVRSDLFENVEGKFDLITFNPPYLPDGSSSSGGETWQGGKTGIEITSKFLDQVDSYLEEDGYALVIVSTNADHKTLFKEYSLEKLDERKLWFETIILARYK